MNSAETLPSEPPQYTAARLQQALAEDPRSAELGIRVMIRGEHVFLRGDVTTLHRCEQAEVIVAELAPSLVIHNELRVIEATEPISEERLQ